MTTYRCMYTCTLFPPFVTLIATVTGVVALWLGSCNAVPLETRPKAPQPSSSPNVNWLRSTSQRESSRAISADMCFVLLLGCTRYVWPPLRWALPSGVRSRKGVFTEPLWYSSSTASNRRTTKDTDAAMAMASVLLSWMATVGIVPLNSFPLPLLDGMLLSGGVDVGIACVAFVTTSQLTVGQQGRDNSSIIWWRRSLDVSKYIIC